MFKLSMYLGRHVCICLYGQCIKRGLFEHYLNNQYYIVRCDGSRYYFRSDDIKWLKME